MTPQLKEIKIEVTYKCPLACVHCSSDANEENNLSMSKERCFDIIRQAVSMGVSKISFSGGEPLLWDGLIEAIDLCSKHKIETSIYTSGNIGNQEEIFNNLLKAGLNKVIFSLYSDNESEHSQITRKNNSFGKTINAIKLLSNKKITPELHFVALAKNYKKLDSLARYAKTIGVNKVSVLRFVPQGRGAFIKDRDMLDKSQNKELKEIIETLRKDGFNIRTGSPFNVLLLNDNPECLAAQDRLTIAPDCRVYPCDAFKQFVVEKLFGSTDYSILSDVVTLQDCWEKSIYFKNIRNEILALPAKPCKECVIYNRCASGCAAQKYIHYSKFGVNPDPACLRDENEKYIC